MAGPIRSFGHAFSRLGRLENAWAGALAHRDASRALSRLRKLYPRFERRGPAAAGLWLPFQDSVLDARFAPLLDETDFDSLRRVGERFAAAGGVAIDRTWWPLIQASVARGTVADHERSHALLTALYGSPFAADDVRLYAATTLARLGAVGTAQLMVYADVTARLPYPPAEVAELVDRILRVGFDDDHARLQMAYPLAGALASRVPHAGAAFACGLAELLVMRRPETAAWYFEAVLGLRAAGAIAGEALRGLLAAHLHSREFAKALSVASTAGSLSPRCTDLVAVCRVIEWFDAPRTLAEPESPADARPVTSARLAEIGPGRDVGPWRDYALGRSHLLDGDAQQARRLLEPLPAAGLSDPDVRYHLAWAHLLCQNPEGVRAEYHALAGQTGSWAIACLLLDADPEPDQALLGPAPLIPGHLLKAAAVRSALIAPGGTPEILDRRGLGMGGSTQSDLIEAMRTALGAAAAHDHLRELSSLIRQPLFARLPAAEQLIWTALATRPADPDLSRQILRRALDQGRDRAALLLAVDALDDGRAGEVAGLLSTVRGPKAELLRAWAQAHTGAAQDAETRFEKLAACGVAQADYARGLLALRAAAGSWARGRTAEARAHAERAARSLRAAAGVNGSDTAPLLRAAQSFATVSEPTPLPWQEVAGQPWTAQLLGAAQLIRAPQTVEPLLIQALTDWTRFDDPARDEGLRLLPTGALAEAVLRVVLLAEDAATSDAAAAFLRRLAGYRPGAASRDAARRAAEYLMLRAGDGLPDAMDHPLAALAGADALLAKAGRAEAARQLRSASGGPADAPGQQHIGHSVIAALTADALAGVPIPEPLPVDAPPAVAAALAVVAAAGHAADGDTDRAAATLLQALGTHRVDDLIDIHAVLPHLCVPAARSGRRSGSAPALVPLVRRAVADLDASGHTTTPRRLSAVTLARFATIVGDYETADDLWPRIQTHNRPGEQLRQELSTEYGRFLCHRAALAHLDGDHDAVLAHLERAAVYLPALAGPMLDERRQDDSTIALLSRLFPGSPVLDHLRPGRYPRLAQLVAADPGLREALASDRPDRILSRWRHAVDGKRDIELWHTLAVLSREDALARPPGASAAQAKATATALWMLLLAESGLAELFDGLTPDPVGHGFRAALIDELLVDQKTQLTLTAARGDLDTARIHAACLDGIRLGPPGARRLLAGGIFEGIAELVGRAAEFAPIADRAGSLLQDWAAELLAAAERRLTDPAAIRKLPEGIDADYGAAVKELEIVAVLELQLMKVLRVAVEYHNRWLMRLDQMKRAEEARKVIRSGTRFIKPLVPLCEPGHPHRLENQVLCEYFLEVALYFVESDPAVCIKYAEQAREWNPDQSAVTDLIRDKAHFQLSLEAVDRGDVPEAERIIRSVPDGPLRLATELNNRAVAALTKATDRLTPYRNSPLPPTVREGMRRPLREVENLLMHAIRIHGDPGIDENLREVQKLKRNLRL